MTQRVLEALPVRTGRPLDRICCTAGLDGGTVQAALGRLALLGLAERHGPGWRLHREPRSRKVDDEQRAAGVVRAPV